MFDDVICEAPVPGRVAPDGYQTKSFDPSLDRYTITSDGRLLRTEYDLAVVPEEDRAHAWSPPFRRENKREVEVPFHGLIRFYGFASGRPLIGYDQDDWIEYEAKFTDGRLVEIRDVSEASA